MKLKIELTPESRKLVQDLAQAGKVDLRPTMNIIGIGYRKEVGAIFNKQQPRGEGQRWPQLSDRYRAWKERRYPGKGILERTGALKKSMIEQGAPGNISIIGKASGTFGTTINYGIYHDKGGKRIPIRNFSEPSDRRRQIWLDQIEKDIRHNFEKNGISVDGAILR